MEIWALEAFLWNQMSQRNQWGDWWRNRGKNEDSASYDKARFQDEFISQDMATLYDKAASQEKAVLHDKDGTKPEAASQDYLTR